LIPKNVKTLDGPRGYSNNEIIDQRWKNYFIFWQRNTDHNGGCMYSILTAQKLPQFLKKFKKEFRSQKIFSIRMLKRSYICKTKPPKMVQSFIGQITWPHAYELTFCNLIFGA